MNFLQRVQNLPRRTRKLIFWAAIIVIGFGLLTLWIIKFQERLSKFNLEEAKEGLELPSFEAFKQIPEFNGQEEQ